MENTLSERKQNTMIMTESIIDDSKILIDKWINEIRSQLMKKNKKNGGNKKINEIQIIK